MQTVAVPVVCPGGIQASTHCLSTRAGWPLAFESSTADCPFWGQVLPPLNDLKRSTWRLFWSPVMTLRLDSYTAPDWSTLTEVSPEGDSGDAPLAQFLPEFAERQNSIAFPGAET